MSSAIAFVGFGSAAFHGVHLLVCSVASVLFVLIDLLEDFVASWSNDGRIADDLCHIGVRLQCSRTLLAVWPEVLVDSTSLLWCPYLGLIVLF